MGLILPCFTSKEWHICVQIDEVNIALQIDMRKLRKHK